MEEHVRLGMAAGDPEPIVLLSRAHIHGRDVDAEVRPEMRDDESLEEVAQARRRVYHEGLPLKSEQINVRQRDARGEDQDRDREAASPLHGATPRSVPPRP